MLENLIKNNRIMIGAEQFQLLLILFILLWINN